MEGVRDEVVAPRPPGSVRARHAGVRTLVLTHINAHLDSPAVREEGIRDVAEVFDGRIVFGEELLTLDVLSPPSP